MSEQKTGIGALLADWRGTGGDVADLIEAARAGQEEIAELAAAYGVPLEALVDAAPEGDKRLAGLAGIVAREAADLAEHRRWLADFTRRRLAVDRSLRDRRSGRAPGGQESKPRPSWASAFEAWTLAGGRPAAFVELSEADRAALEYSGPLPTRQELAEFEARAAWAAGGGPAADFDLIEAGQREALLAAFGG